MTLSRRSLLTGLASIIAAPAIVRASSLMGMPRPPRLSGAYWAQLTNAQILEDILAMHRALIAQTTLVPEHPGIKNFYFRSMG